MHLPQYIIFIAGNNFSDCIKHPKENIIKVPQCLKFDLISILKKNSFKVAIYGTRLCTFLRRDFAETTAL